MHDFFLFSRGCFPPPFLEFFVDVAVGFFPTLPGDVDFTFVSPSFAAGMDRPFYCFFSRLHEGKIPFLFPYFFFLFFFSFFGRGRSFLWSPFFPSGAQELVDLSSQSVGYFSLFSM